MPRRVAVRFVLAAAALAAAGALFPAHSQSVRYAGIQPPPPPRQDRLTPAERGKVWIPGYWDWKRETYVWIPGRWEPARPGMHWREPVWVKAPDGRWALHRGAWVRGPRPREGA